MYAIYGNIYHQYTPNVAYIPAPWILWVWGWCFSHHLWKCSGWGPGLWTNGFATGPGLVERRWLWDKPTHPADVKLNWLAVGFWLIEWSLNGVDLFLSLSPLGMIVVFDRHVLGHPGSWWPMGFLWNSLCSQVWKSHIRGLHHRFEKMALDLNMRHRVPSGKLT